MILFHISHTNLLSLISRPFLFCFFLYLLSTSIDLCYIPALFARLKTSHVAGLFFFFLSLPVFRLIRLPLKFTLLILALLCSCAISTINSPNVIACISFFLFFLFNYLVFFLIPYNLFYHIRASSILQIYFGCFFCVGAYALCQVLGSFTGIILPGVTQYIHHIARGQAFFYEPSFYALYMTPFAIFYTTKYFLQPSTERKLSCLIWPNFLLLASTSTGCFFSYLVFCFFLIIFSFFHLIKIPLLQFFLRCLFSFTLTFVLIWSINKHLIINGFLKFFYHSGGVGAHWSIQDRWNGAMHYLKIFYDHPLFGVGLGAGPYALASKLSNHSINLLDPDIHNHYNAMNVTTEILASLGLVGACLFFGFCYLLIQTFRTAYRIPNLEPEEQKNLIAFALSICVLFVTLQFSQSLMRPYIWVHIGLFVGYAQSLQRRSIEKEVELQNKMKIKGLKSTGLLDAR